MSEWWVSLQGADIDLAHLATRLTSSDFRIQRREGTYFLTADSLNQLGTAHEVREKANEQLGFINGMTRLILPGTKPIFVGNIERVEADGKTHHKFLVESGAYTLQERVVELKKTGEGDTTQSVQEDPTPGLLVSLALSNPTVARVLTMFGQVKVVQPWKDLYPIYEIIKRDVGGDKVVASNRWTSGNQIGRFTRTANHYQTDGARHGVPKGEPPANPMSAEEAMEFVGSLIVQWIASKQS